MQPRIAMNDDPVRIGVFALLGTLCVQTLFEAQQLARIAQKYVLHWSQPVGLLGADFNTEASSGLFALALWAALLAVNLLYRRNPGIWQPNQTASTALRLALVIQSVSLVEHLLRLAQFLSGNLSPAGLLGRLLTALELDFWLGSGVFIALLIAAVGFRPIGNWQTILDAAMRTGKRGRNELRHSPKERA